LDELLQAAEQSRSSFLDEVVEFSAPRRRKGDRAAVLVTSRDDRGRQASMCRRETTVVKLRNSTTARSNNGA